MKINIKREQITKEEIAANKNFGNLFKEYKALHAPFYKTTWFYTSLSAAAAVVLAILLYVTPDVNKNTLAFISPPLEKVKIAPSQYSVNADVGTIITYKTGSVIKIPPKAFVDKGGNPVYGKVDIAYRELSDPVDFFISGIPMNYDSAGVRYTFESAGMIEIRASQQGKEVNLNPQSQLAIALASHQPGKQFNLYQLDTEKKQWIYRGQERADIFAAAVEENKESGTDASANCDGENDPDKIATLASQSPALQAADSKIENIQFEIKKSQMIVNRLKASKPFEPKEETKGHHRFNVNVSNLNEFPEFAIYKDIMFQAGEENKGLDKNKVYTIDWDDARLSKKGENYILTLKSDDLTAGYIVHPVFEGEGYNAAQKIYKTKLAEYQESLVERESTEGEKQQELTATVEVIKEGRDAEAARIMHNEESSLAHAANPGNLVFRNFAVHSCGIWNLDNPTLVPEGAMVNARFTDEQGKEIQFAVGKVYLVEKGRNILFSFAPSKDGLEWMSNSNVINYNPEKENMIWGVTADNKIAVFGYDDFKAIGKKSGDYIFKMKVSDVDLADETQVEYYLNI